jgi:hypothetical protein
MADGKYRFEVDGKKVLVDVYTADGKGFFDLFVEGERTPLNKEAPVFEGETEDQLLSRIRRTLNSGSR